ncbi:MAG: glycosyltransferase [Deltaproteobacteria bacterium]
MKFFAACHLGALFVMALYGLYRLYQILLWVRERRRYPCPPPTPSVSALRVAVQLPIYNEKFVARRLIDAACRLDWPRHLLEIQVLDDSTDETCAIVDEAVTYWRGEGIPIQVVRRSQREGYKAGALAYGMGVSSAEYFAVFDADFLPRPDFLRQLMPYFSNPDVGFVQARWGFINETDSWLTRIQGVLLGAHFGMEQFLRHRKGLFLNFNGTAGILRRTAIEDAGGWSPETVTEDLDLSFRMHLAGWKAVYVNDVEVPSELPPHLSGLINQQRRWAKGSIQTARKLLIPIWRSGARLHQKIEATFHLIANVGWLMGTIIFLTLYPTVIERNGLDAKTIILIDVPVFLLANIALLAYYFVSEHRARGKGTGKTLLSLVILPLYGIGLAPGITLGVIEGLVRTGGIFVRTPKFGNKRDDEIRSSQYLHKNLTLPAISLTLLLYSLLPVVHVISNRRFLALPFLLFFTAAQALILLHEASEWAGTIRFAGRPHDAFNKGWDGEGKNGRRSHEKGGGGSIRPNAACSVRNEDGIGN